MDRIILIIDILLSLLLFFLSFIDVSKIAGKIRWLYLIPALTINVMFFVVQWDKCLISFYIGSLVIACCLVTNKTIVKRRMILMGIEGFVLSFVLCMINPLYNSQNYVDEFEKVFSSMEQHYVLSKEKKINWDELYNKYYSQFVEANNNRDFVEKYKLYNQFGQEFYDGHIDINMNSSKESEEAELLVFGNDYGLSLIRTEGGEFLAFNVEGELNSYSILDDFELQEKKEYYSEDTISNRLSVLNAGIHNGTIITSWNGISIEDLCNISEVFVPVFADETNKKYYLPIHAAGIGEEAVLVSYIDDYGSEKQVILSKLGPYAPRLKSSIKKLNEGYDLANLEWDEKIDEDTVLLRIKQMRYGDYSDDPQYYEAMKEMLRNAILKNKASGKKNLILDIRANSGGSPLMALELASLFAPTGKHLIGYTSKLNEKTGCYERDSEGNYYKDEELAFYGEDLWHDGNIILLVNNYTVSAGDLFTYVMAEFPNVTIMGITASNSSSQAFNKEYIGEGSIAYSAIPILNTDGQVLIDSFSDHVGRVPIDVIIPTNKDMICAIFDNGGDYVLDYAVNYFD